MTSKSWLNMFSPITLKSEKQHLKLLQSIKQKPLGHSEKFKKEKSFGFFLSFYVHNNWIKKASVLKNIEGKYGFHH